MPRQHQSLGQWLLKSPWYVSVILGAVSFIALRWIIPAKIDHNQALHPFAVALPKLAILPLGLFILIAIGSFLFAKKRHRLVDQQTSLEKLRETSWKDFEFLVAEAYRRQGYQVEYSLGQGADGGVDIVLKMADRKVLVQCKQWKVFSVGAPVIREMFGLMTAERADEAIIVTSGKFTRDAQAFAAGKPIRLIDGPQLLALIHSVQTNSTATSPDILRSREREKVPCQAGVQSGRMRANGEKTNSPSPLSPSPTGVGDSLLRAGEKVAKPDEVSPRRPGEGCRDKTLHGGEGRGGVEDSGFKSPVASLDSDGGTPQGAACCPSCGQPMILRTSRRGANAGSQFWGCSTYPKCKGIRNL